jgi:hypothetical protein
MDDDIDSELEAMIDSYGLPTVLKIMAEICFDKADDDDSDADDWRNLGEALSKLDTGDIH